MGGDVIEGTIVDVDEEGNLIMDINGSFKRFTGGELSLRISS
jgi:biotin-(acetyl-CoA carboxylase) ligase